MLNLAELRLCLAELKGKKLTASDRPSIPIRQLKGPRALTEAWHCDHCWLGFLNFFFFFRWAERIQLIRPERIQFKRQIENGEILFYNYLILIFKLTWVLFLVHSYSFLSQISKQNKLVSFCKHVWVGYLMDLLFSCCGLDRARFFYDKFVSCESI